MPKRVLVAYETNAGSTEEVARVIGETLASDGAAVEVRRLSDIKNVGAYDAAVIGAPVIVGWHRKAVKFVRRHQDDLSRMPVAYFITALHLTDIEMEDREGLHLITDPRLLIEPKNPEALSFKERHRSLDNYLKPVLKKAPRVRPVSIALFAGKLDYRAMKFPQMVFVMLLFAEKPRDYRNWEIIRGWATDVRPILLDKK
jgi:menaquinone-dependent protoporphyrinogen IX oxidase